ncbi:ankyrin repeat domain-containing protein [Tenacibaculum maritimum]
MQLLTNQNTNINHVNKKGQSALMKALNNKMDVIQFLLSKGASITHTDNMGNNLSYYLFNTFSSKEDTAFLKKLKILEAKGLVVTKPQGNGNTLYHLAVKKQQLPLLHFIKKYTIDINARNQEGLSPLQKAVMTAKNDVIIKYLISEGANTSIKTEFNETLYDLAKENEVLKRYRS